MLKSISKVIDNVVASESADTMPDGEGKALFDLDAWKYFAKYFQGQEKKLGAFGIVASAQSLLVLPMLYLIKVAFDDAIPNGNVMLLVYVGAGVFVIRFLNSGISLWLRRANLRVIKGAIKQLRCDLLDVLYKLSRDNHTRMDRNTIHARIVQDTERVDNMSNGLMTSLLPSLFSSLALFVVLIFLNWLLLMVSLLIVPPLLYAARLTSRLAKQNVYVFQRSFERFSKGIQFVLKHMDLTKIQSFEKEELRHQSEQIDQLRATGEKMAFSYAIMNQVQTTVTGFAGIVILIVGGGAVATGSMTIGELLSFYVAAGLLNGYANAAIRALPSIITGNESLITLRNLANTDELEPYTGTQQIPFDGAVSLAGVSFGYGGQQILDNVNLDISPHSKVAIIGPNGAGKSTILYLIMGFYRPDEGHLSAGEMPYDEIDMQRLRRSIGVVMQHPTLFGGTIVENISYGWPEISRSEVIAASKIALADEFIRELPDGYDTNVGDEGVLLSGGECQRLAIARALLQKPRLLVLDEPTNHLDREAIQRLLSNLDELEVRPAILLISHDSEVVHQADLVYELRAGELILVTSQSDFASPAGDRKVAH